MILEQTRRTKLIWSFESVLLKPELCESLMGEQYDAIRICYESHSLKKTEAFLSELQKQKPSFERGLDRIPVMIDLSSKVRGILVDSGEPVEFSFGDVITLSPQSKGGDLEIVTEVWDSFFSVGANVYIGYGNVVFVVLEVKEDEVKAEVVQGGVAYPGMDVHVPQTRPQPSLQEFSDRELETILSYQIDFLVVPGLIDEQDIKRVQTLSKKIRGSQPWIILKLNSDAVYEQLDRVLEKAHGVFISRLEMALFIEPAMIPAITKEVIQRCNDKAKLVFTASEMLGSMRHQATPTRAEVSDIANAVRDGSDAVVLSEEVAYGSHAARAIRLMLKIIEEVEQTRTLLPNWIRREPTIIDEMDAVSYAAYKTAIRVGAKALVCLTHAGNTAVKLSSFRTPVPILAVTFSKEVLGRLSLVRGVNGILLETNPVIDQVLPVVNELLLKNSWLESGDSYVFVTVTLSPLSQQESNLLTVQTLH